MAGVEFLVIGHTCKDIAPTVYRLGGTVTYASVTARRLGLTAGIVTRAGDDVELSALAEVAQVCHIPSRQTTTFHNVYDGSGRTQYLHAVADPITSDDVPARWLDAPIVLLGPMAQELDVHIGHNFSAALVGASPQGWMRVWDSDGLVHNEPARWETQGLDVGRVVVLSEEDIAGDREFLGRLVCHVPIVVLTLGSRGAEVFQGDRAFWSPPRPAHEVDPTGAGDVFAAAFLIRLHETGDAAVAARFANVVASFCVEGAGTSAIPARAVVDKWLAQHPASELFFRRSEL